MRSPSARLLNSRASLYRYAPAQDADAGQVPSYTEIARNVPCALAPADATEQVGSGAPPVQGKIMTEIKWTLVFAQNYSLRSQDKVVVTDNLGVAHPVFIHGMSTPGARNAVFVAEGVERT